jgi:hypothetical protein
MSAALRKRMVEAAKERLAELSRQIGEQDAMRATMFPSTLPGDRGCVSPLNGVAKPAPEPKAQPKGPKKFVW